MGYNTEFRGELKFTEELTGSQIYELKKYLGEDWRDHKEWNYKNNDFYYIDLELLDDYSGIEWNGSEKTKDMASQIRFLLARMNLIMVDFGLEGTLIAQGEDIEDRYKINVKDNVVSKVELATAGSIIECPDCGARFELE